MNLVYVRVALYFLAPLIGMLPGVIYDAGAATIVIDIETAAMGIAASATVAGGMFAVWGKK